MWDEAAAMDAFCRRKDGSPRPDVNVWSPARFRQQVDGWSADDFAADAEICRRVRVALVAHQKRDGAKEIDGTPVIRRALAA